jgi:LSD1 subclass zinc finger protein
MPVNVVVVCPNCKKPLRIPSDALGKNIRCPACQAIFVAQRDEFKPAAPAASKPATTAAPETPSAPQARREDALSTRPSAPPHTLNSAVDNDAVDELKFDADAPAARRVRGLAKKKSWLPLILILIGVLIILPAIGCGGIAVGYWLLAPRYVSQ